MHFVSFYAIRFYLIIQKTPHTELFISRVNYLLFIKFQSKTCYIIHKNPTIIHHFNNFSDAIFDPPDIPPPPDTMFYFGIYLQILVGYGQVGSGPVESGWFGLGIVWYDWL